MIKIRVMGEKRVICRPKSEIACVPVDIRPYDILGGDTDRGPEGGKSAICIDVLSNNLQSESEIIESESWTN